MDGSVSGPCTERVNILISSYSASSSYRRKPSLSPLFDQHYLPPSSLRKVLARSLGRRVTSFIKSFHHQSLNSGTVLLRSPNFRNHGFQQQRPPSSFTLWFGLNPHPDLPHRPRLCHHIHDLAIKASKMVLATLLLRYYACTVSRSIYAIESSMLTICSDRSPNLPTGFLNWIKPFWKIPDEYALQHQSLDAYLFLRFLRMTVVIMFVGCCITWPVL